MTTTMTTTTTTTTPQSWQPIEKPDAVINQHQHQQQQQQQQQQQSTGSSGLWKRRKQFRHHSLGCIYEERSNRLTSSSQQQKQPRYRELRATSVCPERIVITEPKSPLPSQDSVSEIDAGTPPPADDSLFFSDRELEALRQAQVDGASLRTSMWAALSVAETKSLLDLERPSGGPLQLPPAGADQRLKNVALLWACHRGLAHLLPELERRGAELRYIEPCTGMSAGQVAALSGSADCLAYLLRRAGLDLDYANPALRYTALHFAALANSPECARLLLDAGAKLDQNNDAQDDQDENNELPPDLLGYDNPAAVEGTAVAEPVLHCAVRARAAKVVRLLLERGADPGQRNARAETPLHVACIVQSPSCAELLLRKCNGGSGSTGDRKKKQQPQQQQTRLDVNGLDRNQRTALHYAVMHSSRRRGSDCSTSSCCSSSSTSSSSSSATASATTSASVNSSYGSSTAARLVELLLQHGAAPDVRDKQQLTALHIAALNEQSECAETLIWAGADLSARTRSGLSALNIILRKMPESLQAFRQRLDSSIRLRRPVPHNREFEMRLHFEALFSSDEAACETSFINCFVQERQKELLSHPLVMAFLHLKWEKIRKFYLMRIMLYTLTVVCMTTYVLTALAYRCYNHDEANSSKICNSRRASGFLFRRNVIQVEWYVSLVLALVMIPRKVFGFMVHGSARQYFMNVDNLLDSIVIVSVFVTSFVYTGRTYDWQNYVGAFAILCAWTNLMLMVGQLPAFGTYVAMFTHIQFEFAKLLLAYSGLLIGFTISFCVIFVGEPSFGNPLTGLIKVLAMMAGELDFEGLINQEDILSDGSFVLYHPLSVCSQILFTLFIVFVTVILMNLLVGIAVHDIQGLRNHAGLTKLVRQTKLILFSEQFLHTILRNKIIPRAFERCMSDHKIDVDNRKRVLVVKPLNPLEKRLPKDILKAAYEVAQKNAPLLNDDEEEDEDDEDGNNDEKSHGKEEEVVSRKRVAWAKNHEVRASDCFLQATIHQLATQMKSADEDIKNIKEQLLDTNKMLKCILSKASTR